MTYNPRYYLDLMDNYGLKKIKDLYAYRIDYDKVRQENKIKRVADISKKRYNVTVRPINMKDFKNSSIPVLSPKEYLAKRKSER